MLVTAATSPGDPNTPTEDWFAATPDLVVALDGATVRTETGCTHGAAWYTRQLGAAITARADGARSLRAALADSIRHVNSLHPECDHTHPGTPSAAVGIVQLHEDRLRYLVLGDITIVIPTPIDERPQVISDPRVSATALEQRYEADLYPIGSPPKAAALLRMKHAELAARNQPSGYWIASTNPDAADQAVIGDLPAELVREFAVLTDGAARYVDLFQLGAWTGVMRILRTSGPSWFINKLVRPVEAADPLGVRYPRNKRSDDATALYAELKPAEDERDWSRPKSETQLEAEAAFLRRITDPGLYGDGNRQKVLAERGATY